MEAPRIDSGRIAEVSHGLDRSEVERREKVFSVSDLARGVQRERRARGRRARRAQEHGDGVHRAVRVREEHVHPLLQPHERPRFPGAKVSGTVLYHGQDLYARDVDAVEIRRRIGMVFQKPNPFPKSIYDNIAFGPRVLGMKGSMDERVEQALRQAALWDEVKDRLKDGALGLSGGQQQRLCIARALAVEPDVILMDEPASALDPISTTRIEDLMHELKRDYTIVIVTHNMQQAARVADMTAFFSVVVDEDGSGRRGHPRRVRLDDEDLHDAVRQADGGLRHGEIRMRVEFQGELDALEAGFQETGEIVLRSIRGVVDALRTQDVELCDEVIAFDDEIDDRYHALEKQIELVLARQTPVAGDLRLVLALLHSGLHVERMGDQCVTIAKLTKLSSHLDTKQTVIESLVDMGERCEEMVKVSLDAFADARRRAGRGLARARRARRPRQSAGLRRGARVRATIPRRSSGACARSPSRAASSGSATTPSTSASRRRSS